MFLDVVTNIQRHKIQRKRYPWCWDTLNLNKRKLASEVHKFHLEPFVAHKVLRRNPSRNWLILIFSGEKPCTRIIQNILHSFIHFSRAKDVISHPKLNERKFLMGAGEHECQISQNYILHIRILPAFSQFLWNLTFIFSDSDEKFSLVLLQKTNYILTRLKSTVF